MASPEPDSLKLEIISRKGQSLWRLEVPWDGQVRDHVDEGLRQMKKRGLVPSLSLKVPAEKFFRGSVLVPDAARAQAREIIGDLITRKTPFRSAEVLFGYRLESGVHERDRLEFAVISASALGRDAARAGVSLSDIDWVEATPSEGARAIFIRPCERQSDGPQEGLKLCAIVALVCATTFAATVALIDWRQQARQEHLNIEIDRISIASRELINMARSTRESAALVENLVSSRGRASLVEAWEAAARTLPASSWITEFRLEGATISMSGYSDNATELAALLMKSDLFADARLNAPIVIDASNGKQRFGLEARFREPSSQFGTE